VPASASWRIFCGVELSDNVRAQLQDHIWQLRAAVPDVAASWTRVENIHLTLKFFGDVSTDLIPAISTAASRAAKRFGEFHIGVGGTGVFPKPSRPQVLWIGVNDTSGQLAALQKELEKEFSVEGFQKEVRAFRPHLTIARIRKPQGAGRLADAHLAMEFKSHEMKICELIVFRSELSSKGSKYTAISRHEFKRPQKAQMIKS
jgi:2'-5' RNA ligase